MTEQLHFLFSLSCIGEGNGNPLRVLAWRVPGTGEPGKLPSMGSHRVGHDWSDLAAAAAAAAAAAKLLPESESRSVVSNSLQPHGLYSPWNSLGQNSGVGSLFLLQGIFPTQGSNPGLPHCRRILYLLSHKRSPRITGAHVNSHIPGHCMPRVWHSSSSIGPGTWVWCRSYAACRLDAECRFLSFGAGGERRGFWNLRPY